MSSRGGRPSQQQNSILNFFKKERPKQKETSNTTKKESIKPIAAVTPLQVKQNRDAIIDTVDLTQSPEHLPTDENVFESDFNLSQDPSSVDHAPITNNKKREESWLTQLYGKTPPYPSSCSSESSKSSSMSSSTHKLKAARANSKTGQAAKSLKFDETKSPWDDDEDDFQVDFTKPGVKSKDDTSLSENDKKQGHNPSEIQVEPNFSLNHEVFVEESDIDIEECEALTEEPAFLDDNMEDPFDEDASPPHTPPAVQLLETCPLSKLPENTKLLNVESSPLVAESQDFIDPSPIKPPQRRISSTTGRSRLSSNRRISPVTTKSTKLSRSNQDVSPKNNENLNVVTTAVNRISGLELKIRKTSTFNKTTQKMTKSDIEKHENWKKEFENEFTQLFLHIDFSRITQPVDSDNALKIENSKKCYKKICSRLEETRRPKTGEVTDSYKETSKSSGKLDLLPDFDEAPPIDYDESPPFEMDGTNSRIVSISSSEEEIEHPSSPILSRNSSVGAQVLKKTLQSSSITSEWRKQSITGEDEYPQDAFCDYNSSRVDNQITKDTTSGKSSKFKFKKPGAGISSNTETVPATSTCHISPPSSHFSSIPSSNLSSIPNTPDHIRRSDSGIFSKPNSMSKSLQESGTQFIEDFNTQKEFPLAAFEDDDGFEEEEINYNKQLYETQDNFTRSPSSSFSRKSMSSSSQKTKTNLEGKFIGEARNDGKDPFLSSETHSFSKSVKKVLTDKFGIRNYRPNQLQAVNSAILGNDTFVLMPTGGGKSLCYQLPAAFQGGMTVVISPLVSLIQDQVTKLNGMNISADHLSGDDYSRQSRIYAQMRGREPGPTLLYVTPEKITSSNQLQDALLTVYNQGMLQRFVIDEAHCVSQWGHDFRPDYKKLSLLRSKFPNVPMMALTATATPRVRTDILFQLKMNNPKWFLSSFNRSNLKYEVRQKKGKSVTKEIASVIQVSFRRQSGIVYCLSKRECEETAKFLVANGIPAAPYHAGLPPDIRFKTQDDWVQDKIRVVCATIAFGMGIDKPDVRFVLHQSLPKSIEGYYQESGRAGRDGEPSRCILFYHYADMHRLRKLIDMGDGDQNAKKVHYENLWQMVRYAENLSDCRRVLQLQYFGEVFDHNRCGEIANMRCDNCTRNCNTTIEKVDITETAKQIVLAVQRLNSRAQFRNFTINQFVDVWRGMKNQKTVSSKWDTDPIYGKGKAYNALEANRILKLMVIEGYLWENMVINKDQIATAYLVPGSKSKALISGSCTVLHQTEGKIVANEETESISEADSTLSRLQEEAFDELKHLILMTGREMHPEKQIKGVNEIIPLQALKHISEKLPDSMEALGRIEYMTAYRMSLYGEVILSTCKEYSDRRMEYLANQAQANQFAREEDEFVPGGEDGGGWLSKSTGRGKSRYFRKRGGFKRKRTGSNSGGRFTKKTSFGSANSGSGSGYKRGGASSSRGGASSSSRAPRGGRGGSMGLPKRMGVNA